MHTIRLGREENQSLLIHCIALLLWVTAPVCQCDRSRLEILLSVPLHFSTTAMIFSLFFSLEMNPPKLHLFLLRLKLNRLFGKG